MILSNAENQFAPQMTVLTLFMGTPSLVIKDIKPLLITAKGHGTRQMCRTDKYGFKGKIRA
jgi:hypothetical protein